MYTVFQSQPHKEDYRFLKYFYILKVLNSKNWGVSKIKAKLYGQ